MHTGRDVYDGANLRVGNFSYWYEARARALERADHFLGCAVLLYGRAARDFWVARTPLRRSLLLALVQEPAAVLLRPSANGSVANNGWHRHRR